MNRLTGIVLTALYVGLFATSIASAQQPAPGGAFGGFGPGFGQGAAGILLLNPQVQKELKFTDDQTAKAKEIATPQNRGGVNFGAMSEEERKEFFANIGKKMEENSKKLQELLTAEQNSRFKQIQLWVAGSSALTADVDVGKELALTDDQKEALKAITGESAKKGQEIRAALRGNGNTDGFAKMGEQLAALRAELETECMAVLTAKQKTQFEKMRGPKFVLEMPQFGRGGRGGRPGGNSN